MEQAYGWLEELAAEAKLSPREREVLELIVAGVTAPRALGLRMGLKPSTACVHKHKALKKLLAAREAVTTTRRAQEAADAASIEGDASWCRFLLDAVRGLENRRDHGPLIGRTWTDASGLTLSEEARVNAGSAGVLTVGDLVGEADDVPSALSERVQGSLR